ISFPPFCVYFLRGSTSPTLHKKDEKEIIYNLNGQQVDKTSAQGGIFISRQKGKFYKASGSSGGRR
ncbi:hypothetical protein, partial [Segatella copri]|uniref:hypothetical protein n=1 Tax=Segatella copri TaxID=165179 RepID=UPI001C702842